MAVNGVRLVLLATQEATVRTTVLHYSTIAPHTWTAGELLTLATNWWNAVRTSAKASVHSGVNFLSVTATDLSNDLFPTQAVYNIPQPEPGLAGGDAVPANVAACIAWKTPYANRRLRGRTFWYGLTEGFTSGSTLGISYLTLLSNFATAVGSFNNPSGVGVYFAVYSRASNIMTAILTYIIDSVTDSQRRRLPLRGI